MSASKSDLRRRFDTYRRALDESSYTDRSHQIVKRLISLPEIRSAHVVHVYWPMVDRREVDTRPFIHWLKDHRKEIVLPVVLSFQKSDGDAPRLGHVRYPGEEGLHLNRWGISEPVEHHPVSVDSLEVVIVPALGAGRNGHRIGYGFGYYDEFLASVTVPSIALVFEACLVDTVPREAHDTPLDVIVSESEVVRPARTQHTM